MGRPEGIDPQRVGGFPVDHDQGIMLLSTVLLKFNVYLKQAHMVKNDHPAGKHMVKNAVLDPCAKIDFCYNFQLFT